MIPVSVVIITKNEERNIQDALESVKEFEDIVVVDSFSEDRTVEICRRYTNRVFQHAWQGYARQKQIAVDYAKKQWVLILDADERVTPELASEIKIRLQNSAEKGFFLPRRNYFLGRWIRHSGWWPDYSIRLFEKDASYVEQREVHEKVIVNGHVGHLKNPLDHYTYRSIAEYIHKMDNYSTLAAKETILAKPGLSSIALASKMIVSPAVTFFRMLILRQGFRDGMHGFILACLYCFYTFLKYAKVWEQKR